MLKGCVNIYYDNNNYNDCSVSNLFNFCVSLTMEALIRLLKMALLSQWFSTLLMLRPFNSYLSCGDPPRP